MSNTQLIQIGIQKDRARRNAEMAEAVAAQQQGDYSLYSQLMSRPIPRRSAAEQRAYYIAVALGN